MRQGIVAVFIALAFLGTSLAPAAAASPGTTLTTSPVVLSLPVKPGTSVTKTLQLMNNGSQPVDITMGVKLFGADGVSGNPVISNPSASDPTPKWVSFSPASFTAQPGVWSSVKMTINLPSTAQLGYYLAAVFQPQLQTGKTNTPSAQYRGSNAILVLIDTQSGNEQRQVNVSGFTVTKHVYEYLPATFNVKIHNSGNIYMAPYGNIFISRRSDLTDTLATLQVNPNGGNVLPNSSRVFQTRWSDGFPAYKTKTTGGQPVVTKQGQPVQQLHWDFSQANKFRFGKYYAKLMLVYNNGKQPVSMTSVVSFWVIPWKVLIVIVLILLLFIAGIISLVRNVLRRRQPKGGYARR